LQFVQGVIHSGIFLGLNLINWLKVSIPVVMIISLLGVVINSESCFLKFSTFKYL